MTERPSSEDSARLELAWTLYRDADNLLERALRERFNLSRVLEEMFQLLGTHLQASHAWVRTYDDRLVLSDFQWRRRANDESPTWTSTMLEALVQLPGQVFRGVIDERPAVGLRLEVAGDDFGLVGVVWDESPTLLEGERGDELAGLVEIWCEVLDNHLAAHAAARRKQMILGELSAALRNPILSVGLQSSVEVLAAHVPLTGLALVYTPDGRPTSTDTRFVSFDGSGELRSERGDDSLSRYLDENGLEVLHGDIEELKSLLGASREVDNILVNGVTDATVVGRLVAAVKDDELSTYDHELFERFADNLRQRLVDFNREFQNLSHFFSSDTVARLLSEENYEVRLEPTEQSVAVLYTDIAGFTRLSEQILKEPRSIGKLVNIWGAGVVDILWRHGGAFDKMVGDCVIGLWGPPFFDLSATEACAAALHAAVDIERFTRDLYQHPALPELAELQGELGVATGVNYCPMFVGRFGPDEDYTGFSSGMNNTARLQGVAERGEILCMDAVIEAVGEIERFDFSEWREAQVKNVADPLRFKACSISD
ncbi:MAG: adenylate/guanylate cyclase domain-containing protein [Myxococcota bacterium]